MYKRNKEDDKFEIDFYEAILKDKPDFIEALAALGDLYTKEGLSEKGLEVDERLNTLRPNDSIILYNLACSYSLVNRIDDSLNTLKHAVKCGYNDIPFMEKDDDLDNLRKDRRYHAFLVAVKHNTKTDATKRVDD